MLLLVESNARCSSWQREQHRQTTTEVVSASALETVTQRILSLPRFCRWRVVQCSLRCARLMAFQVFRRFDWASFHVFSLPAP